jgi:hypothetical protein
VQALDIRMALTKALRSARDGSSVLELNATLSILISVVVAFALLYNISFIAAPALTTGRLAVAFLAMLYWRHLWSAVPAFCHSFPWLSLVLVATLLWSAILCVTSDRPDFTQLSRVLHFLFFCIAGSILFLRLLGYELDRFLLCFGMATLVQSAFIWVFFITPEFRIWVEAVLVRSGHIEFSSQFQSAGFSNSAGAATSLVQGLGAFCLALAAVRAPRVVPAIVLFVCSVLVLASTILVGRTGMIVGLLLCSMAYLQALTNRGGVRRVVIAVLLALALSLTLAAHIRDNTEILENTDTILEWAFGVFNPLEDASIVDLAETPIPPLTSDTIVGTGLVWDESGFNVSGHDSGYVQTYYALGLLFAVLFYGALAGALLFGAVVLRSWWIAILTITMFVVEVKEPFIFKYTFPFLIFSLAFCWPTLRNWAGTGSPLLDELGRPQTHH